MNLFNRKLLEKQVRDTEHLFSTPEKQQQAELKADLHTRETSIKSYFDLKRRATQLVHHQENRTFSNRNGGK
jgi:hypothetical protein